MQPIAPTSFPSRKRFASLALAGVLFFSGGSQLLQAQSGSVDCLLESFDGSNLQGFTTQNASALPDVGSAQGRYRASLTDNSNNITLHFNNDQGRLDAWLTRFPFEYVARNIGIGTLADSQQPHAFTGSAFNFAGVQVHVENLQSANSSHVVVGHRNASATFTIEGKNTVDGVSTVNDLGAGVAPAGRADLRIVGEASGTLTVYWQLPNPDPQNQADNWIPYNGTGKLPGSEPNYGSAGSKVYVGPITYAYGDDGVPFVGTIDSVALSEQGSEPCLLSGLNVPVVNPAVAGLLLLSLGLIAGRQLHRPGLRS